MKPIRIFLSQLAWSPYLVLLLQELPYGLLLSFVFTCQGHMHEVWAALYIQWADFALFLLHRKAALFYECSGRLSSCNALAWSSLSTLLPYYLLYRLMKRLTVSSYERLNTENSYSFHWFFSSSSESQVIWKSFTLDYTFCQSNELGLNTPTLFFSWKYNSAIKKVFFLFFSACWFKVYRIKK